MRVPGPSGSDATKQSDEGPDGDPLYVWPGYALVRPGRCDSNPGMHVTEVQLDDQQRSLTVESDWLEHGCPGCGVLAVGHGRRCPVLHDAPSLGRVTVVRWLTRVWRCLEPSCTTTTFTEQHPIAPPRAVLTVRAVRWATDALSYDDTTVSALARHLGVAWHTAWTAIETEAKARVAVPERLAGVRTLGVDEHIWRPSRSAPIGR